MKHTGSLSKYLVVFNAVNIIIGVAVGLPNPSSIVLLDILNIIAFISINLGLIVNLFYFFYLKTTQVQLKSKKEETAYIVNSISNSKITQRVFIICFIVSAIILIIA